MPAAIRGQRLPDLAWFDYIDSDEGSEIIKLPPALSPTASIRFEARLTDSTACAGVERVMGFCTKEQCEHGIGAFRLRVWDMQEAAEGCAPRASNGRASVARWRCPLRDISRHLPTHQGCPLCPRKQMFSLEIDVCFVPSFVPLADCKASSSNPIPVAPASSRCRALPSALVLVPWLEPGPPLVAGAWAVELVLVAAPVRERSSPEQTQALEPVAAVAQEPKAPALERAWTSYAEPRSVRARARAVRAPAVQALA